MLRYVRILPDSTEWSQGSGSGPDGMQADFRMKYKNKR